MVLDFLKRKEPKKETPPSKLNLKPAHPVVEQREFTFILPKPEDTEAIPMVQLPLSTLKALLNAPELELLLRQIIHAASNQGYPIVQIRLPKLRIIIPTSPDAVTALIRKNSKKVQRHQLYDYAALMIGKGSVVLSDGNLWQIIRQIATKHLNHGRIMKEYSERAEKVIQDLDQSFQNIAASGKPVEILDPMSDLSIEFLARALFGNNASLDQRPDSAAQRIVHQFIQETAHHEKESMRQAVDRALEQIAQSMSLGVVKSFAGGEYRQANKELYRVAGLLFIRRLLELYADQVEYLERTSQDPQQPTDHLRLLESFTQEALRLTRGEAVSINLLLDRLIAQYHKLIEQHTRTAESSSSRNDLLTVMITSYLQRYAVEKSHLGLLEQTETEEEVALIEEQISQGQKKYLSREQVMSNITAFIIAGFETTATALSNALIYLAQNPEVLAKAHQELDQVYGSIRFPTMEKVGQLVYIRKILLETIRLVPAQPASFNQVIEPFIAESGGKSFSIQRGDMLVISARGLNTAPKQYKNGARDSETFNPSRWNRVNRGDFEPARDHYEHEEPGDTTIRSFNDGSHRCAAEKLALDYEMPIFLAYLLMNFRPVLHGQHWLKVTMAFSPAGTKIQLLPREVSDKE